MVGKMKKRAIAGVMTLLLLFTAIFSDIGTVVAYADENDSAPNEVTEQCASVKADVSAGEVESGTKVTLSCETDGATIYYSTAGDSSGFGEYSDSVEITKDTTIYTYASKDGYNDSTHVSFAYTVKEDSADDSLNDTKSDDSKQDDAQDSDTDEESDEESEDAKEEDDNDYLSLAAEISDGDQIVVYNSSAQATLTATVSGKKLAGATATVEEKGLLKTEDLTVLSVVEEDDGYYSIKSSDGKYLTCPSTGNGLSFADSASDYSLWSFEPVSGSEGSYVILSKNALYRTKKQAVEYYKKVNLFTTYSYTSATSAYTMQIYLYDRSDSTSDSTTDEEVDDSYTIDDSITATIAQWAGNANYTDISDDLIYGDLLATNDMLDTTSVFEAYISGEKVQPYTTGKTNAGDINYYMGAEGIGTGSDDYFLFTTSSSGYGNMSISFRLRATKAAPAYLQLKYSTDGVNYYDFTTGTYSYSYTSYDSSGKSQSVTGDGAVTDGTANMSKAVANYLEYTFDVPAGAENAKTLYIKMVPSTVRASDSSSAVGDGNIRVDSVVLSGSPVVSDAQVGYVKASINSGEAAIGSEIVLTTETSGATIFYSMDAGKTYTKYTSDSKPTLTSLPASLICYATKDGLKDGPRSIYQYTQAQVETVKATPNGGAITAGQKVSLKTNTDGATIYYAILESSDSADDETDSDESDAESDEDATDESTSDDSTSSDDGDYNWVEYTEPISVDTLPAKIKVKATKDGYLDSAISTLSFTERENEKYNIYFGQIHSHTNFSDGSGSPEDAFAYASNVDNLDFFCVTDHSNSLDNASDSDLLTNVDTSDEDEWTKGHNLAKQYTTDDFTCIYGFEMTWSNGLGHMNTFNTAGFQSRTQTEYSTYSTALTNYYAKLRQAPDSVSMFNHPGTTFGDFQDFSYYTEANDAVITMIEVGNGEGTIGSSGYFPSYEYYTRALDKGWHVAPTNNQDNHKGKWGDANTARTVVLADSNTEENIYDAMRNYRIYATEDNDLNIYYTLDGYIMGTQLEQDQVGDTVELQVELSDITDSSIGKVEVIVNGGLSIANKTVSGNDETVTFTVPSSYSYYYIKVTEADGDIAVTAPVWVGEVEACGINSTYTNTSLAVAGEDADINVEFYNNEKSDLEINSITFTSDDEVLQTVSADELKEVGVDVISSNSTGTYTTYYTPSQAGSVKIDVTVEATLDGVEKQYTSTLTIKYTDSSLVANVIVDGTHYNDYVTGYYGGNVTSFVSIAADYNVRVTIEKDEITAEDLEDCAFLVLSAPAKKTGTANAGDYVVSHYSDEFLQMVADYVAAGGSVIVCGLADYSDTKNCQTATEQNKLLEAIGATVRMNSDEAWDDENNGGQEYRLYPNTFNYDCEYMDGVVSGQTYSQYSGCTVNVKDAVENDTVYAAEALVSGYDTTYSVNCKNDTTGATLSKPYDTVAQKGEAVFFAHQATKAGGDIFVAGGVFLSDFEVDAEIDNNDSLPYANATIIKNILSKNEKQIETSTIAEARAGSYGEIYSVVGYVTAGTDNEYNTFFDTIYIQDDTAGIDIFPYAESGLAIGTKIQVTGTLDQYQGDKELRVISYKILSDDTHIYEPQIVDTKTAMDYDALGGSLLQTSGIVTRVTLASDGTVSEFWIKDDTGVEAAIFIDGYIFSGTTGENTLADFVKVGAEVSAIGILYMHPEDDSEDSVPVFRVRNCDDITLVSASADDSTSGGSSSSTGSSDSSSSSSASSVISQAVSKVVSAVTSAVKSVAEAVTEAASTAVNNVRNAFRNLTGRNTAATTTNSAAAENTDTDNDTQTETESEQATVEAANGHGETTIDDTDTPLAAEDSEKSFPVLPVAGGATIVVVAVIAVAAKKGLLMKVLKLLKL